ncbi:MAG: hypothetical protein Q9220_006651 [cf. Caloplaca sp. 1 TL-2023]
MPKKRTLSHFNKPAGSVHPSISSNRTGQDDTLRVKKAETSVNDLLQHLRVCQAPSASSSVESRSDENPRTVHPSLNHILQVPETPPPRPRPGMRSFIALGRRRPAGPPPPRSWQEKNNDASASGRESLQQLHSRLPKRPHLDDIGTLPGIHRPSRRSLQHQTMLQLAKNWDWHVHYDQHYLALLPVRYKQLLLSYIAKYNPKGISIDGFNILFLDDTQLEGATGTEGLTHLDLAVSVGRWFTLTNLKTFLTTNTTITTDKEDHPTSSIPESWDAPASSMPTPFFSSSTLSTLTHLSLAHPGPTTSWRHLLHLSPHLSTLTHLSLAHWPPPSLTPNSSTAYRATPAGDVAYGDHDFYSASLDNDFSGAAAVLRRLSRDTYCLRWLDLTGCGAWMLALAWQEGGIEWEGAWSGVETVVACQGWMPKCLEQEGSTSAWRDVLRYEGVEAGRRKEKEELVRWCRVEHDVMGVAKKVRERGKGKGRLGGKEREREEDLWVDGVGKIDVTGKEREESSGRVVGPRRGRIGFELGWEGWWVRECLLWYRGIETRWAGPPPPPMPTLWSPRFL